MHQSRYEENELALNINAADKNYSSLNLADIGK